MTTAMVTQMLDDHNGIAGYGNDDDDDETTRNTASTA